jgi:SWI/SNF-related matrix-associated actin-dependent regulator 1 of chromatin subfamily A
MQKKDKKNEKDIVVKIRKLRVNYELRYDFLKILSEYIKRLPKEHRKTRKDSIMTPEGKKDDWVRVISDVKMGEILNFLIDNNIKFVFENIPQEELNRLRNEYIERQNKIAQILKLKAEGLSIEGEDYSFMKIQPYDYQKKAIKFFELNDGRAILGDQPGVGKSCPAFAYAVKHKLKTLIVCPSSLKLNWRKEILKFTNEKAFIYKFVPKRKSKIVAYEKEESLFHIINFESIERPYIKLEYRHKCSGHKIQPNGSMGKCGWDYTDLTKKYATCPSCGNTGKIKTRVVGIVGFKDKMGFELDPDDYDLIVIDECHRIKEIKTTWTRIIHEAFKGLKKKILLSGTVIKSRPKEFFSTLNFVYPEEWKNSHDFGVRYCAGYESGFGWNYDGASNLEELFVRVSPFFLRRLKKDVLKELPEKTYVDIPIELTDQEYREYTKILKEVKTEIVNEKEVVKKEGFLEKIHKLKKFTGLVKMNRVFEMIEDIISTGEKVVVISDYQEIAETIKEYFAEKCVLHTGLMSDEDKQESVDRFQEDEEVKVFSGMVIASGVGITLTASSKLFLIGFPWTPSDKEQVEDRIHRASSTSDKIDIITLICQDTVDEDIMELLDEKAYIVTKTLDNKEHSRKNIVADESIISKLIEKIKTN